MLARRSLSDPTGRASCRVFAPDGTTVAEPAQVAGRGWTIEMGSERAKGEVGADEYAVRRRDARQRHLTFAPLADAYSAAMRLRAIAAEGKGGRVPG